MNFQKIDSQAHFILPWPLENHVNKKGGGYHMTIPLEQEGKKGGKKKEEGREREKGRGERERQGGKEGKEKVR